MSVLIKGLEMPETEYMDIRIYRDGTAVIALGKKPYYREFKAEPVRHAKLLDAHPYGECSNCGYLIDAREGFNYCPACGARVNEE